MENLKSKALPLKAIVFVTLLVSSVVYGYMSPPHEFEGEVVTEDFRELSLDELKSQDGEQEITGAVSWIVFVKFFKREMTASQLSDERDNFDQVDLVRLEEGIDKTKGGADLK